MEVEEESQDALGTLTIKQSGKEMSVCRVHLFIKFMISR
jgi:hypothetical protein